MKYHRLMVPGPVDVVAEVREQLSRPITPHFGKQWVDVHDETTELMKQVFRTTGDVFLIVGSGSAGLDAVIGTLLGTSGRALVLSNGWFGERLGQICSSHTPLTNVIRTPRENAIDPGTLESALQKNRADAVLVAHCETSTGVLNPIEELGLICAQHDVLFVVDAVSSLGGAPLNMDDWQISACVTATQKCLESPPGLAPVAINPAVWKRLENVERRGWYLNLKIWKQYSDEWADWHPHPVTMPTGLVAALRQSLDRMINEEGLPVRFERHSKISSTLRKGLQNLGFEMFASEGCASPTVTGVCADERISVETLQEFLENHHEILIGGSLGEMKGKLFRIGTMGPSATYQAILPLLFGIEEALRGQGHAIEGGQAFAGL